MGIKAKTVRERILYEYAKLIADAALREHVTAVGRTGGKYWGFVAYTYRRLLAETISPSSMLTENKRLLDDRDACAYCGATGTLQWEHIIPRAKGGPDNIDNLVRACSSCNQRKGARNPVEWYGKRRDAIPRLVMGKLLKQLLEAHSAAGTLHWAGFPQGERLSFGALFQVFEPGDANTDGA